MARLIELPDGQYAEFPDDMSDSDIESALSAQFPAEEPELDSAWDFSGERTIFGRALEMNKAIPRDAISTVLTGLEGTEAISKYMPGAMLGEYIGKKTLGLFGIDEAEYEAKRAEQREYIPRLQRYIQEDSILAGDEKYKDLWTTQLGSGVGSFGAFALTSLINPGAGAALAVSSGAGTQAQKIREARESGVDVSAGQEFGATLAGSAIGALEMYTPFKLVKALKSVPKNIPLSAKEKLFGLAAQVFNPSVIKTAGGEGIQEVISSILQQIVEMGYNPDAELPSGESLWNDFSIGAVTGGGADIITNVVKARRLNAINQIDAEREREFRQREEANNFLMGNYLRENAELRDLAQRDPDAFNQLSLKERQAASAIEMPTTEEVLKFNEPSMATKEPTPASTGELYAMRIIGRLRSFFPTNTTFGVAEGPGGFVVTDADGTQYGKPMADQRVASSVAANLNREVSNKGIRGSILNTLMTSPEEYSKEDMDALFRYGFRTLSPEANRVSFAALNEAAGTTTEKGYVEDLPMEILATAKKLRDGRYSIQMPDGSTQYIAGLTAAQKLNMERVNAGLPAATTFDINEARQALGGKIGALSEPTVSGIMDTAQYGGTLQDGKPVVLSDAGEVLTGRVVTDAEKARAGKDADGNNILPDFLEFKTLDEAKRYAGRLNQRGAASRFIPLEILMGKENLSDDIKRLMKAKNITSETNSPEVKQLVKAFTGAESFGDMSLDDQKLFYSRVRELPTLSKPTKLPSFSERLYTPEQFLQAVKAENEAGRALTDAEIAAATGLNPDAPGIADIRGELRRQNQRREEEGRREVEEVQPLEPALRKILESFKLDPNLLRLRTRLYDENGRDITEGSEGYYEPALNELALAIDSIDPQGIKTEAQRIQALRGVLTHESIHILRQLDLFTQKEWSLLENAVARTKRKPKKGEPQLDETYLQRARRMYPDYSPVVQVEEAIAELARDAIGDRRVIGGKPKNLIDRIVRFFTQLRNFMDGYGFTSFQDVLRAVETGEVGGRERGQVRSLRGTEGFLAKEFNVVPARYAPFIDEFAGASGQTTEQPAQRGAVTESGRLADFDPAALEGADVRYSRQDAVYAIVDNTTGKEVGYAKTRDGARRVMDRRDNAVGGYRHSIVPLNEDVAEQQRLDKLSKIGGRRYSVKDISGLKDSNETSLRTFAENFAGDIKQGDRTVEAANRIAKAYVEDVVNSPEDFLPTVTQQTYDYIKYLRMPDGTMYDPENLSHANASIEAVEIDAAIKNGTLEELLETNITRLNETRIQNLSDLARYVNSLGRYDASEKAYPITEQAIILKAASKYGTRFDKEKGLVLVPIEATNETDIAVITPDEINAFVEELRKGKSLKEAMLDGVRKGIERRRLENKKAGYDGWKKFEKSPGMEDAAKLKDGVAGREWCTAKATSTAHSQLQQGDFYVYYKDGDPIVAVRTVNGRLAEPPRGSLPRQYLTEEEAKIAEDFLKSGEVTGGEDYLRDMKIINEVMSGEYKNWDDFTLFPAAKRRSQIGYGFRSNEFPPPIVSLIEEEIGNRHDDYEWEELGYFNGNVSIYPEQDITDIKYVGGNLSINKNLNPDDKNVYTVGRVEGNVSVYGDHKVYVEYAERVLVADNSDVYVKESGMSEVHNHATLTVGHLDGGAYLYNSGMLKAFYVAGDITTHSNARVNVAYTDGEILLRHDSLAKLGLANKVTLKDDAVASILDVDDIVAVGKSRAMVGNALLISVQEDASVNALETDELFVLKGSAQVNKVNYKTLVRGFSAVEIENISGKVDTDLSNIYVGNIDNRKEFEKENADYKNKIKLNKRNFNSTQWHANTSDLVRVLDDTRLSLEIVENLSGLTKKQQFDLTGGRRYSRKDSGDKTPITDAVRLAKEKYGDLKIDSEEEFFKHWSKLIKQVGRQLNPTPYGIRVAAQRAIKDMESWIKDNSRYADYYDKDMVAVRDALEEKYGKVTDDDMKAFQLFAGLTSPNTGLKSNISDALALLDLLKSDGNLDRIKLGLSDNNNVVIERSPFQISGNTNGNKARSAKVFDRLVREKGSVSKAVDFLMEPVTDKQLKEFNREMGYKSDPEMGKVKRLVMSATGQDQKIPRMFIFGPKVGAYTMNLTGDRKYTTIDIWESRFIRSYFNGLFKNETGLPVDEFEHDLFTQFGDYFKEEFDKLTGKDWDPASLQAMRWFYIINATNKAGYTGASTNDTISEYTRQQLYTAGKTGEYRRGQSDAKTGRGTRKYSRQDQPTEGQPSAAAGESGLRDRGGIRGGEGLLRDTYRPYQEAGRAGKSLKGLLKRVKVDDRIVEFESFAPAQRLAEEYMKEAGMPYSPPTTYVRVDPTRSTKIADEFGKMQHTPQDPLVQAAYRQMMKETSDQYRKILESGLKVEFIKGDDPYGNPRNAILDVIENNHFWVFPTVDGFGSSELDVSNNPLLEATEFKDANGETMLANDVFRVVHDYFGHIMHGVGFRADGEENAWRAHASMYSPLARRAMTTETRGQNSYVNYGPNGEFNRTASPSETIYADQKVGLLPEWVSVDAYEGALEEAVQKAQKDIEDTPVSAVPLYNPSASPEALYVAQNPEQGGTLSIDEKRRYSRKNTPNYSPKAREIIDKNTPRLPDEPIGSGLINMMSFPDTRDMWDKLRAGIFNRYARIERITRENEQLASQLADVGAYAAIEMSDRSRYFTAMAASEGVIAYENGMVLVKDFYHKGKKIRGLIGLDEMLFSEEYGNLEELAQAYATAVRGERLNAEGKLTPVSPGELAELKKEVQKFINPETGNPIVLEWFDAWQDYNSYTVKFLRDTGAIDEEAAALWLKQSDYVPFYREDANGNLVHPRIFGGLHTAGQFKAVGKSDKAINVDMRTAIFNNIDVAIAMGMKNVAQQRVVRDLLNIGLATMLKSGEPVGNRQTINFKVKGKQYTAIIEDPLLYEAMLPMSELNLDEFTQQVLSLPAETWREMITRNPSFGFANAFRDSFSAFMITGANIVPVLSSVKYFFAPLSEMLTGKRFLRDISEMERMGIISGRGGYDLAKDANSVKKFYAKELNRRRSKTSWWKNPLIATWDVLGRFTERTEAATRLAVYNDILKRTGSPAEAQYQAISVMNYARRGNNKLLRLYASVVPFTNANLQGKDKLYQAITGRIGARYVKDSEGNVSRNTSTALNRAVFAGRALLMLASTVLYYAMVSDDDEYLTASAEMRDNYYIIPITKGSIAKGEPGLSIKLPIAFDVGSLFKVIPERIMALGTGKDTNRDLNQSMIRQLKNQLLGGMPINIKPIYESYITGIDSFTGRPVVPTFMQYLEPEQQKSFYTNRAISKVAEMAGISPMKLEHVAEGYFPGLGAYLLQVLDSTARYLEGPEARMPATQWFQIPFIKRFFTTVNQPGLVNQFYDLKDNVDGIVQTINRLEKEGRDDELALFYAKNGHMYEMRSEINSIERQIKELRDERKIIEQMPIDQESKRVLIEEINMQINASLLTIPMLRQEAYGSQKEQ